MVDLNSNCLLLEPGFMLLPKNIASHLENERYLEQKKQGSVEKSLT